MNLLIKGISISLLSLVGAETAFAHPDFISEPGSARHRSDYPAATALAAHHAANHHESNVPWPMRGESIPAEGHREVQPDSLARSDESRLSPEQRRALRQEIREAGRELYRSK